MVNPICPKCGSDDIEKATGGFREIIGMDEMYTCNKCKHTGTVFPELSNEDEMKEDLKILDEDLRNGVKNYPEDTKKEVNGIKKMGAFFMLALAIFFPFIVVVISILVAIKFIGG